MLRAGLWPTRRQLVLAILIPGSTSARIHLRAERTLEGREQLADFLAREAYIEVVVPEPLHRFDAVAEHLQLRRLPVWLVPGPILDDVLDLIGAKPTAALTIADALARLPTLPTVRPALRLLPPPDPRQLRLALPRFT